MKYILSIFLLLHCFYTVRGFEDEMLDADENDGAVSRVRRGGLSMLRLGRGLQMLRLGKRVRPTVNVDRTYDPEDVRYVLSVLLGDNDMRRQIPFPRYGRKDLEWLLERLGQNPDQERRSDYFESDDNSARQIRPAPRPGKFRFRRSVTLDETDKMQKENTNDDQVDSKSSSEERTLPLPRIGRFKEDDKSVPLIKFGQDYFIDSLSDGNYYVTDKRGMPMLRLGRAMPMLRLGKRPFKMLRLGRAEQSSDEQEKRGMPMLRLGKRPFKMLRLGKRLNLNSENQKRAMPMLRLGRSV